MKFAYVIIGLSFVLFWGSPATAQKIDWIYQDGDLRNSVGRSVSTDSLGNVFVSGYFSPSFPSSADSIDPEHVGRTWAFVSKYDNTGNLHWTKEIGTDPRHALYRGYGSSTDGLGNVYIVGETTDIQHDDQGWEVFIRKYDTTGKVVWSTKLGTDGDENGTSVIADGLGNVYITGTTSGNLDGNSSFGDQDAYLSKFDDQGTMLWTQQLGTSSTDRANDIAIDSLGNLLITGYTDGDLSGVNSGNSDAFLSKYDPNGNLLWSNQLGSSVIDESNSVATDSDGNVFITGFTTGDIEGTNAGSTDAFVSKFNSTGNWLWTSQLGTNSSDESNSLAVDEFGNVYISGYTDGDFPGSKEDTLRDAFVSKLSTNGTLLWSKQIGTAAEGTAAEERSFGVSVDNHGNIFTTGLTSGNLGGPITSTLNVYLAKILPYSADFDDDTDVDIVDFNHWETNFGQNAVSDADFDGDTDGIDFLIWQRQLGSVLPTSTSQFAATTTVPEPTTLLLLTLATATLLSARNR